MQDEARHDCVFCNILAGASPGYVVGENESAIALLDINPQAVGHCLVVPRRHVQWWHDLEEDESEGTFALARETARRIKSAFEPDFVAMYARGRRIPHTHVFLVPTWKGDALDRHFNALEGWQESAVALAGLHDPARLAETMARLKGM